MADVTMTAAEAAQHLAPLAQAVASLRDILDAAGAAEATLASYPAKRDMQRRDLDRLTRERADCARALQDEREAATAARETLQAELAQQRDAVEQCRQTATIERQQIAASLTALRTAAADERAQLDAEQAAALDAAHARHTAALAALDLEHAGVTAKLDEAYTHLDRLASTATRAQSAKVR